MTFMRYNFFLGERVLCLLLGKMFVYCDEWNVNIWSFSSTDFFRSVFCSNTLQTDVPVKVYTAG